VVRYADDVIALCHSQEQAQQVKARLAEWLRGRGLVFNEDKTKIVHLAEGFDFLGVSIRRYPNGKLMTKPGAPAVRRLELRLAAEMNALRGTNAQAVIIRLDPIVRGWAAYYRSMVASRVFTTLDQYVWRLTCKGSGTPTRTSRDAGWLTGTSAGSTSSGTTGGCSATATAVPTCPSSPGPTSSGMSWSWARHPPMTPTRLSTGPDGARGSNPPLTGTRCGCSPGRTHAAPCAENIC
jgi:Group II intron, maturase-specific domain/Reverse transcriptase (RNA-dependent DNA polymerase)